MNKKIWIAIVAIFVISVASLITVMAYRTDSNIKGPNYNAEVHEQLEEAMNANDYDAWIQIRKDNNLPMQGKIFQVINKDNFDRYVDLHNAMLSGDIETADLIRTELGLAQGMKGKNCGSGTGCQMHSQSTQENQEATSTCQHSKNSSCTMSQTGTCPMKK